MRVRIPVHHSFRRRRPTGAQAFLRYLPRLAVWTVCLYAALTALGVRTAVVDTRSMHPALEPGDRLVASPVVYGTRLPWGGKRLPGVRKPERGDLVMVLSPALADPSVLPPALAA